MIVGGESMKYIRTKDGRIYCFIEIKEIGDTIIGYVNERDKNALDGGSYLDKSKIFKIADTIEELVDGYIVEHVDGTICPVIPKTFKNAKEMVKIDEPCYINAFIKTSEGLIFVAKMNEKGELELLWTED